MQELIRLLKKAHAIETGAIEAYEGHARSVKDPTVKYKIQEIQKDEWFHRQEVGFILNQLGEEPNHLLDKILWFIGRTISIACHVMGYRAALWGAKIMESMGSGIYDHLSISAFISGDADLSYRFMRMADQERDHEAYFKGLLSK